MVVKWTDSHGRRRELGARDGDTKSRLSWLARQFRCLCQRLPEVFLPPLIAPELVLPHHHQRVALPFRMPAPPATGEARIGEMTAGYAFAMSQQPLLLGPSPSGPSQGPASHAEVPLDVLEGRETGWATTLLEVLRFVAIVAMLAALV